LYKAPAQNTGKALIGGAAANWQVYPAITGLVDHSFGRAVEHVVALNANNKFIAYSNVPPDLPKVKTKSNSKGVLMMDPGVTDAAAWIVHTVPGFPKALRGYVFPPAEIQKGHLLICLTIKESQIDPIARTLRIATPLIYHSDIPDTQMNSRPNLKKLVDGESRFMPPLTVSQEISTENAQGLKVSIYSKGEKSRYEIYKRILVKQLKSTIKVWTTRDNILKSDCRKFGRNIKLITSPISVNGDASQLENDDSHWLVSEPGNKFCAVDKPYHKSQAKEPAMAVCIDDATIFTRFNEIALCWKFCICLYCFFLQIYHILKHHNVRIKMVMETAIVYKAPAQPNGKIIFATAAGAWDNGAQPFTNAGGHSFGKAIEHVVGNNGNIKFLAYNNAPPGVPNLKTKSNSKGIIILSDAAGTDSAAWIVHTVPGFPTAKIAYNWPVAENARGHLLICLTISESQINAIAASLLLVQPVIYYNDIPKTETAAMPYFNKLAEGKIPTLPPFTSRQTIRTQNGAAPVTVHIYKIYKKVIVKVLKKTIKVWSRRDSKLKGDCRGSQRHIRLIKSPAAINGHNTNLESDITNWALLALFLIVRLSHSQTSKCQNKPVYKAPGQNNGKIIFATAAGTWDDGAQALSNNAGHSFAKTLEDVVRNQNNIKFLAYNNAPPGVPSMKTKSNSKGVIILATNADSAAWIVHTVPGFPTARTAYSWPVAENARGHLLICLTISKSQINAIAASLLLVQPMVHYNDIPETETAGMPYFNKLAEGKISPLPPFTSRRSIRTEDARSPVAVWSRRDNILKGDCRGSQRHIRLIKSPAAVRDHNTNLEADITNWAVSDPGNIFCHIDKPYFKNQTKEPAMAVCIENNDIFARFNEIAAQLIRISAFNVLASDYRNQDTNLKNVGDDFCNAINEAFSKLTDRNLVTFKTSN
ncbi:Deoxyribonuclease-2-alpha, partial [Trichinella spiralis]